MAPPASSSRLIDPGRALKQVDTFFKSHEGLGASRGAGRRGARAPSARDSRASVSVQILGNEELLLSGVLPTHAQAPVGLERERRDEGALVAQLQLRVPARER